MAVDCYRHLFSFLVARRCPPHGGAGWPYLMLYFESSPATLVVRIVAVTRLFVDVRSVVRPRAREQSSFAFNGIFSMSHWFICVHGVSIGCVGVRIIHGCSVCVENAYSAKAMLQNE